MMRIRYPLRVLPGHAPTYGQANQSGGRFLFILSAKKRPYLSARILAPEDLP